MIDIYILVFNFTFEYNMMEIPRDIRDIFPTCIIDIFMIKSQLDCNGVSKTDNYGRVNETTGT